jgi:hypothetical protein
MIQETIHTSGSRKLALTHLMERVTGVSCFANGLQSTGFA